MSGGEWYGPEGNIVQVPYIDIGAQIQGEHLSQLRIITKHLFAAVSAEVCTTGHVTLDTVPYSLLNCELILDTEVLFITLYVSPRDEVIGGVTLKREFDDWLQVSNRGFLLDRWSFARL